MKFLNIEVDNHKKETHSLKKSIKEKDKELFKAENKSENFECSVKRLKTEISSLKSSNKKLSKEKFPNTKQACPASTQTCPPHSQLAAPVSSTIRTRTLPTTTDQISEILPLNIPTISRHSELFLASDSVMMSSPPATAPAVWSSPPYSPACQPPPSASIHSPCTPPGWPKSFSQPQSACDYEEKIVTENNKNTYEENNDVENNNHEEKAEIRVLENDTFKGQKVKPKCILSAEVQEILKAEKVDFEKLVDAVRRDEMDFKLTDDEDDSYSNYENDDYPDEYWDTEIQDVTDEAVDDQKPDNEI